MSSLLIRILKSVWIATSVRQDLASIIGFCQTHRGEYEAPPNEQALWLRIRNVIEAEQHGRTVAQTERRPSFLGRLMGHSWELSLPQLTAVGRRDRFVGFVDDCRWFASLGQHGRTGRAMQV